MVEKQMNCSAIPELTLVGVAFLNLCIFKKREYGSTAYIIVFSLMTWWFGTK